MLTTLAETEARDDSKEPVEVPDPEDDDIKLNDMAHLYLFKEWWMAGQTPIGLSDLLTMPAGLWDDFKKLLAKYSQFKRIIKSRDVFDEDERRKTKGGLFRGE